MRIITRTVWILSLVSFFTDVASEMLYPVMPLYLEEIHFSIWMIGLLEGLAEAVAGLSKGYFGKLSDHTGKRLPFVRWGYLFSAISKPMMAMFTYPLWIFAARTTDRLGKGLRTGARDAMLSGEATKETRAAVFGFHRSIDTLGAVLGPLSALLFLYFYPKQYETLFYIAFIPGLAAIASTFIVKDKPVAPKQDKSPSFFSFVKYWGHAPAKYRRLVAGLLLFALFNSSDVFLLLKMKEAGIEDATIIGVYIFYNLVYALLAYPLGRLADRVGLKAVFVGGLLMFAGVYFGMAFSSGLYMFLLLFLFYGVYAAATEGIAKAWIANIADKEHAATAIGTYTAFQSICALLASSITGLLWFQFGAGIALLASGAIAIFAALYFLMSKV